VLNYFFSHRPIVKIGVLNLNIICYQSFVDEDISIDIIP